MKALLLRAGELRVDEFPDPIVKAGQIIVKSLCCCICASDLHMVHNAKRLSEWFWVMNSAAKSSNLVNPYPKTFVSGIG